MAGRGRIQHSWFREVPRQISSPFVLPFARCQSMNSVCLGRRAHRYTDTRAHTYIQGSFQGVYFNRDPFVVLPGRRPRVDVGWAVRKGRKSMLRSKVIRANVRDVKPRRHSARRSCLDLSRGLLLTFNGPILCRPILRRRGRRLP